MKPRDANCSHAYIRQLFDYFPDTGIAVRRARTSNRVAYGDHLGPVVRINGVMVKTHRAIWFWMTGEWPPQQIDHIDNNRSNNRWENLRLATNSQNTRNTRRLAETESGIKGVSWYPNSGKWRARITGLQKYFDTKEEAVEWVRTKREELHGEFANHG